MSVINDNRSHSDKLPIGFASTRNKIVTRMLNYVDNAITKHVIKYSLTNSPCEALFVLRVDGPLVVHMY